ncbi:MAG: GNAT family N-acetyltransferase [Pseudomonadota bacterium]
MTDWQTLIDACWPAENVLRQGPWTIRVTHGAGSRVSAISGDVPAAISEAEAATRAAGQAPNFILWPEQTAMDDALARRGYGVEDSVTIWWHPVAPLTTAPMPYATAFTIWPPLQIMRDLWQEGQISAARQAVMARAANPAGILARVNDRAAGAGFVAAHGDTAMLSAIEVSPKHRRKGVAGNILRAAAHWAKDQGCSRIALIAADTNVAAHKTYASHGMQAVAGYHYRRLPE